MPAVPAQDDRGGAAPVEHEDRLLAGGGVEPGERGRERAREQAALARRQLGAQVDDLDVGRRPAGRSAGPRAGSGRSGRADAVDRGRGRPEDDGRAGQPAELDGDVAGLEPRRPVALVRGVVLLVDDDEADVGQRRQDREPRPDDDVHVAAADASPLVGALAVAEAGMDERDPGVEVGPQAIDERQRQRDLRDEDEGRPAGLDSVSAIAST